ncbi:MAG: hypothetical protein RLZZ502_114 [Pseudomonadota bacterium]|jgi:ABC-type amino acid transport substrate-binding protein
MRLLSLLFLTVLGVGTTQGGALDDIKARGSLKVGVYNDFAPFHDKGKGIEVDLANALAAKLGVKANVLGFEASDENMDDDLRNMVWKGHYLGWGPADVLLHVPVVSELMKGNPQVSIFSPYYSESLAFARDTQKIPQLNSMSDVGTHPVGAETVSLGSQILLTIEDKKYMQHVKHYRFPKDALAGLLKGEVAAVLAQRSEVESVIGRDDKARYQISPPPFPENPKHKSPIGMAVKKASKDLADALSLAIKELKDAGELQKIFARHGVTWIP